VPDSDPSNANASAKTAQARKSVTKPVTNGAVVMALFERRRQEMPPAFAQMLAALSKS